ncbi:sporulation protein YunB [Paenibacillus spiritus]|uniref:sporulation protein YunB n=1 Tax=Paenibacillus spiritus TaxID=2496557 RepID=UPI00295ED3D1|nr:sporulation protein YunB [Paenibacillus spiritus]
MGRVKKWGGRRFRLPPLEAWRLPVRRRSRGGGWKRGGPPRSGAVRLLAAWLGSPRRRTFRPVRSAGPLRTAPAGPVPSAVPRRRLTARSAAPVRAQRAGTGGPAKPRRRLLRILVVVSLVLLIGVLQGLRYVERHMKPPILHLAQIRVKQIATESINKAITSQVVTGGDAGKLIDWKSDRNGKITGFMLNYAEHMRITSEAAEVIQSTLQSLHNRTEHIPLGQALGSPLIASFGPDIPVKIEPQGAVKVELNTRQQNAGINMILVEVYIHIITEVAVVIPFDMEPQTVDTEIPVSYLMVVGDVPMYYYDNQGRPVGENSAQAPGIALPAPSGGSAVPAGGGEGSAGSERSDEGGGPAVSSPPAPQKPEASAADSGADTGAGGGE